MRNEGWAMFGAYETIISASGKITLNVEGKLKAPFTLSD